MTFQHSHRASGTGDIAFDAIDPDFDAFDPTEDDFLDRCLFEIRESLTDYRNL